MEVLYCFLLICIGIPIATLIAAGIIMGLLNTIIYIQEHK